MIDSAYDPGDVPDYNTCEDCGQLTTQPRLCRGCRMKERLQAAIDREEAKKEE